MKRRTSSGVFLWWSFAIVFGCSPAQNSNETDPILDQNPDSTNHDNQPVVNLAELLRESTPLLAFEKNLLDSSPEKTPSVCVSTCPKIEKSSGGATFNGKTDCLSLGKDNLSLTAPFSIALSFFMTAFPNPAREMILASKYNSHAAREFVFGLSPDLHLSFSKSIDGSATKKPRRLSELVYSSEVLSSVDLNQWVHIAFTMDADGQYKFYKGGKILGSGIFKTGAQIFKGSADARIGCVERSVLPLKLPRPPESLFKGKMKGFGLFNKVLSPDEIEALSNKE